MKEWQDRRLTVLAASKRTSAALRARSGAPIRRASGPAAVLAALMLTLSASCEDPAAVVQTEILAAEAEPAYGTATFSVSPVGGQFLVVVTSSDSSHPRSVTLYRAGGGRPPVGTYTLGPLAESGGVAERFTAIYSTGRWHDTELFAALYGEVNITHSTEARLDGTFHFSGAQFSETEHVSNWAYILGRGQTFPKPDAIDTNARIEVSGSFSAPASTDTLPTIVGVITAIPGPNPWKELNTVLVDTGHGDFGVLLFVDGSKVLVEEADGSLRTSNIADLRVGSTVKAWINPPPYQYIDPMPASAAEIIVLAAHSSAEVRD